MATEKNRFSVSLDDETYNVYKRFAQLSGKPMATIIAHMLVEAREHFVKLGVLLQRAHDMVGETHDARSAFVARIDMGMHRAVAAADLIDSDLVEMMREKPARSRDAAQPRREPKASHSLIHRNKSPKSTPTRVPARSKAKKQGGKRATT
jgi:hypothetical protein